MQAGDKNIQDHPAGLATGKNRRRQQTITAEPFDIGGSSWHTFWALPDLNWPD
jgi:F0F1-type ATP synthase gamma subunit